MLAFFLIVLFVPLSVAAMAFIFLKGISLKEFCLILLAQLIVAGSAASTVSCVNTHDTEVWNGRVASKERKTVSCLHSYPCNCRTVCSGGKNSSCSTTCDTCYEHLFDYDWDVHTTNGEIITIDRVDRQGFHEPSRFTSVIIGEPTAVNHNYVNYVKASPGTLFKHQGIKDKYADMIPRYPRVYDYYRLGHLIEPFSPSNMMIPSPREWNRGLAELNAELGSKKQVNVLVMIVGPVSDEFFYALEEAWTGGKKNDVILVISVDDSSSMKPRWASVIAWTSNEFFKVKLRDDVMANATITHDTVLKNLRDDVEKYYERKPMADFKYLSSTITPSTTEWVITLIVGLIISVIMTLVFNEHDVFGDERLMFGRRKTPYRLPTGFKFRNPFSSRPWENVK